MKKEILTLKKYLFEHDERLMEIEYERPIEADTSPKRLR